MKRPCVHTPDLAARLAFIDEVYRHNLTFAHADIVSARAAVSHESYSAYPYMVLGATLTTFYPLLRPSADHILCNSVAHLVAYIKQMNRRAA